MARQMGDAFTAPTGRRIPAQGATLGKRRVHRGVLKERRIGLIGHASAILKSPHSAGDNLPGLSYNTPSGDGRSLAGSGTASLICPIGHRLCPRSQEDGQESHQQPLPQRE